MPDTNIFIYKFEIDEKETDISYTDLNDWCRQYLRSKDWYVLPFIVGYTGYVWQVQIRDQFDAMLFKLVWC
jgi:hypothetical protein